MKDSYKKELINIFMDAGIAFYLDGDWKNPFRLKSKTSIGKLHKITKLWTLNSKEDFQQALDNFFKHYE